MTVYKLFSRLTLNGGKGKRRGEWVVKTGHFYFALTDGLTHFHNSLAISIKTGIKSLLQ
jgi:hypothetical protein